MISHLGTPSELPDLIKATWLATIAEIAGGQKLCDSDTSW
jgi:hypothetical protein